MIRRFVQPCLNSLSQRRFLNVHEFVGKQLMGVYGIDHQRGFVVRSASEVAAATEKLPTKNYIVKAQVLAGGRGKGTFNTGFKGGVKFAKTKEDAAEYTEKMLGNTLVTHQTGAAGQKVSKVFIAECLDIQKEYYFAILLQGKYGGPVLVGSPRGGVDIETVAKENPEDIYTQPVPMKKGLTSEDALTFANKLGFKSPYAEKAADSMVKLYKLMMEKDSTMIEINPFVETPDQRVVCIDAKFNFDDSASFRQKAVFAERDIEQEDAKEVAAEAAGLNYIALDGNIACLVNGAGLAMATMDIIGLHGGRPANFLDVGGGATAEQVTAAFKIIMSDPNVKGILINIFGGIMRCDTIAEGVIMAAKQTGINLPVVVRLAGTNQEKGAEILKKSEFSEKLISAIDLDDAAKKIVALCSKN
jgi:succinyl-CoA synthetase beta subunit